MDKWELMESRHSVRAYLDKKVEEEKINQIKKLVEEINAETGFHFEVMQNEPEAFQANKPSYGRFKNACNYIVLAAPKHKDDEIGYYGEKIVLKIQELGLNSCWVALTFERKKVPFKTKEDETLYDLISFGYGETQGVFHKSRDVKAVSNISDDSPEWFKEGMRAVMLAPTALNQQKFYFELLEGNKVKATYKFGPYVKTDIGIVKYHFELGAGKENFEWA